MNDIKWIPVDDSLPPEHIDGESTKYYLVKWETYYPNFGQALFYGGEWYSDWVRRYCVPITHWADLEKK